MMIKVEAIVREEVFDDVKQALNDIKVNGITVSQVMGCGTQRGYKKLVRGTQVDVVMQPKIKFEIVVSSEEWEKKDDRGDPESSVYRRGGRRKNLQL